jgi:hypothetical protein
MACAALLDLFATRRFSKANALRTPLSFEQDLNNVLCPADWKCFVCAPAQIAHIVEACRRFMRHRTEKLHRRAANALDISDVCRVALKYIFVSFHSKSN